MLKHSWIPLALIATLSGGVHAQTPEQVDAQTPEQPEQPLDRAMKTIDELSRRVQALETERDKASAAAAAAAASSSGLGATVVSVDTGSEGPLKRFWQRVGRWTRAEEAGSPDADKARIEIYGQVMIDAFYDFKRMDPDWSATMRPSKIPVVCPGFPGCGKEGAWNFSARQSGLGLRSFIPTPYGPIKTDLNFDLFGLDGSTSIHWLKLWAEFGVLGIGQTDSNFMDIDVFPSAIDYWGPSGMVFLRNPQVRITAWAKNGVTLAFSLEAPSSALDTGKISESSPDFGAGFSSWNRLPDLTASFRYDGDWGHVKAAGLLRMVGYQNTQTLLGNPSGANAGYGVNLTGTLKVLGRDQLSAGFVWGRAIASYMNDGGFDLAPGPGLRAEAVQSIGWLAYYNHFWAERWSSAIGFSQHLQDNTVGQTDTAFKRGSYGTVNLQYTPWKNVLLGLEFGFGELAQKDGRSATDFRLQSSTRITF